MIYCKRVGPMQGVRKEWRLRRDRKVASRRGELMIYCMGVDRVAPGGGWERVANQTGN